MGIPDKSNPSRVPSQKALPASKFSKQVPKPAFAAHIAGDSSMSSKKRHIKRCKNDLSARA